MLRLGSGSVTKIVSVSSWFIPEHSLRFAENYPQEFSWVFAGIEFNAREKAKTNLGSEPPMLHICSGVSLLLLSRALD
jgi:hypothetical protein